MCTNFACVEFLTMSAFREKFKHEANSAALHPGLEWSAQHLAGILFPRLHAMKQDSLNGTLALFQPQSPSSRRTLEKCSCFINKISSDKGKSEAGYLKCFNDVFEFIEDLDDICPLHPRPADSLPCVFLQEAENLDGIRSLRCMSRRSGLCLIEPCSAEAFRGILRHLIDENKRCHLLTETDLKFLAQQQEKIEDQMDCRICLSQETDVPSLEAKNSQFSSESYRNHDVRGRTVVVDGCRMLLDEAFQRCFGRDGSLLYVRADWLADNDTLRMFATYCNSFAINSRYVNTEVLGPLAGLLGQKLECHLAPLFSIEFAGNSI
ncbi:uncharacterized protein LOC125178890 [Hyalella azteca]|uniref:Uncharacterized protein LOC125178890 n=1 Tax=Hyalella azteca TaxID=294128 RepID=A0A979FTE2_HYAAZ|nr:uncharacterized protein LOC125178890 [Hyalella azteca]